MESNWAENAKLIKMLNEIYDNSLDSKILNKLLILNNLKFQNYELFKPGLNFFEHLYLWLKNFEKEERKIAMKLIFKLSFFTQDEMQNLSRQIFQEVIKKFLLKYIIKENNKDYYDYKSSFEFFPKFLNQSLFIALSDGAMIDYFRRVNNIKNDQIISYYKLHLDAQFKIAFKKWEKSNLKYRFFFLIEDFIGTGTTFIRDENNLKFWLKEKNIKDCLKFKYKDCSPKEKPNLDGQLIRFINYWDHLLNFNKDYRIILCPYIITQFAVDRIGAMINYYGKLNYIKNYEKIEILPGLVIPDELRVVFSCSKSGLRNISEVDALKIEELCNKYYYKIKDKITDSQKKGGGVKFGFGQRGLSIVRYNNIPNNSIYLIWNKEDWFPLFPRIKRHNK